MTSKILPVEVLVVATAKQALAAAPAGYCQKYSQVLVRNKVPTGKRSHKFYGVFSKTKTIDEIVSEINTAIHAVSEEYTAFVVYSPFYNVPSITIRPR